MTCLWRTPRDSPTFRRICRPLWPRGNGTTWLEISGNLVCLGFECFELSISVFKLPVDRRKKNRSQSRNNATSPDRHLRLVSFTRQENWSFFFNFIILLVIIITVMFVCLRKVYPENLHAISYFPIEKSAGGGWGWGGGVFSKPFVCFDLFFRMSAVSFVSIFSPDAKVI